jgi:hypothetical protein
MERARRARSFARAALPYAAFAVILSYAARERWRLRDDEPRLAAVGSTAAETSPAADAGGARECVEAGAERETRETRAERVGDAGGGRR